MNYDIDRSIFTFEHFEPNQSFPTLLALERIPTEIRAYKWRTGSPDLLKKLNISERGDPIQYAFSMEFIDELLRLHGWEHPDRLRRRFWSRIIVTGRETRLSQIPFSFDREEYERKREHRIGKVDDLWKDFEVSIDAFCESKRIKREKIIFIDPGSVDPLPDHLPGRDINDELPVDKWWAFDDLKDPFYELNLDPSSVDSVPRTISFNWLGQVDDFCVCEYMFVEALSERQ